MALLPSLVPGYRALVFGAGGGIGSAITVALANDLRCDIVYGAARRPFGGDRKVVPVEFDLTDEASIASAVETASCDGPLDLVFVATGVLQDEVSNPEKSLKAVNAEAMEHAFRINMIGPSLIAKHALPKLRRDAKAVFAALSARVGSITDNRLGGWHSYRASKAALNMFVKTCAIELARTHPKALCVTLHPGTVDTQLSKPFQGNVPISNLKTPVESASCLLSVLDRTNADQTGNLFAWDGQKIAF